MFFVTQMAEESRMQGGTVYLDTREMAEESRMQGGTVTVYLHTPAICVEIILHWFFRLFCLKKNISFYLNFNR